MDIFFYVFATVFAVFIYSVYRKRRRAAYIAAFAFPERVQRRVQERYPQLTPAQLTQVMGGLRDYFTLCLIARKRLVAMPSQAVDVAWHEFILFTRNYANFCRRALGRFLHHVPAEAMRTPTLAQDGIKRAWRLACREEGIDPKQPSRLPRLFALDAELGIDDGFHYALDCQAANARRGDGRPVYCASHVGCGGGCSSCGGSGSGGDGGCGGGD